MSPLRSANKSNKIWTQENTYSDLQQQILSGPLQLNIFQNTTERKDFFI